MSTHNHEECADCIAREAAARREALLEAAGAVQRRMDGAEFADGGKLQTWDALAGVIEWIEGKTEDLEGALGDRLDRIKDMGSAIAALEAKVARVEALALPDGIWKGDKHVRLTRRDRSLGCDITESYVRVDDLRAALAEPERDEESGR